MNVDQLSLPELIVLVVVAVEVVIVIGAIVALLVVRRRAIGRERRYERARAELSEVIQQFGGPDDAGARRIAFGVVERIGVDSARRLLTELGEFLTVDLVEPLSTIYVEAGLVTATAQGAKRRPWERLRVIREARALNDPAGLLADLIRDDSADVRLAAFEALCALGRADEALVALRSIAVEGRLARMRAVDALAASEPFPREQLINLATSESSAIRLVTVGALGRSENADAGDVVIAAITDEDVEVRIEALRAVRDMEDRSAVAACIAALQDEFWEVRSAAAGTVADLGGDGAAEYLGPLLDDQAEWVRHNTSLALRRCGAAGLAVLRDAAARGNESASSALAEHRLITEGA
ncbi:MAG: HEAT repeat domain-containing protein [Myxococcales bacterium]|nr:HEAT repeat domain-containing protein [Myxococcales bacterium]